MKTFSMKLPALATALFLALCLPGLSYPAAAGDNGSTVEKTAEPAPSTEAQSARAEYQRQMEERLNEFEKRIEELQDSARKAMGEGRRQLDKAIVELKEKEDDARKQLETHKKSAAVQWKNFRERLNETADEIERAINDAFASI